CRERCDGLERALALAAMPDPGGKDCGGTQVRACGEKSHKGSRPLPTPDREAFVISGTICGNATVPVIGIRLLGVAYNHDACWRHLNSLPPGPRHLEGYGPRRYVRGRQFTTNEAQKTVGGKRSASSQRHSLQRACRTGTGTLKATTSRAASMATQKAQNLPKLDGLLCSRAALGRRRRKTGLRVRFVIPRTPSLCRRACLVRSCRRRCCI